MGRPKRQESVSGFDIASPAATRRRARGAVASLRLTYFANASESAGRYGVTFEDVVAHLWRYRRTSGRVALGTVRHLDDLVHAVACVNGYSAAWSDLVERHETALVRRCSERLGDMQAILLVRRMFANVRADGASETLSKFVGDRPLRTWLAERVMGQLSTVWCAPATKGGPSPVWWHGPLVVTTGRQPAGSAASLPFPTELTRFGRQPETPGREPGAGAGR